MYEDRNEEQPSSFSHPIPSTQSPSPPHSTPSEATLDPHQTSTQEDSYGGLLAPVDVKDGSEHPSSSIDAAHEQAYQASVGSTTQPASAPPDPGSHCLAGPGSVNPYTASSSNASVYQRNESSLDSQPNALNSNFRAPYQPYPSHPIDGPHPYMPHQAQAHPLSSHPGSSLHLHSAPQPSPSSSSTFVSNPAYAQASASYNPTLAHQASQGRGLVSGPASNFYAPNPAQRQYYPHPNHPGIRKSDPSFFFGCFSLSLIHYVTSLLSIYIPYPTLLF